MPESASSPNVTWPWSSNAAAYTDLPQGGQIHKTFTDVEVTGVVDRGLGP
jgi:hypothetical protein